jgi:hypothetical protein
MFKSQKDETESRDAHHRGGDIRSSDETSVMAVEQRDVIIQLESDNNYNCRRN